MSSKLHCNSKFIFFVYRWIFLKNVNFKYIFIFTSSKILRIFSHPPKTHACIFLWFQEWQMHMLRFIVSNNAAWRHPMCKRNCFWLIILLRKCVFFKKSHWIFLVCIFEIQIMIIIWCQKLEQISWNTILLELRMMLIFDRIGVWKRIRHLYYSRLH